MNRADFIPDVIWIREDGWMVPLDRAADPEAWLRLVDGGDAIATQVDDGTDEYDGKGIIPTSSSSARGVMTRMLDLLDIHAGTDVLEIGAGTGYNAALIAERVASGRVTTIELDPEIADHARQALARAGLPVTVITGDGVLGYPERAPYDRIIATASVLQIPYAWVEQTRPGGRIVLPMDGSFRSGVLACLTVGDDGTARGRFHEAVGFMRIRSQRDDKAIWRVSNSESADYSDENPEGIQATTIRAYHPEPFTDFEAGFAVGTRLPGLVAARRDTDGVLLMSDRSSGSWATVFPGDDERRAYRVYHEGPRRLWEELEAAYRWWLDAGRPDHTRFGLTVTPEAQQFWLDNPGDIVSPQ